MFCGKCGIQIEDNAYFCPKCGTMIAQPAQTAQSAAVGITQQPEKIQQTILRSGTEEHIPETEALQSARKIAKTQEIGVPELRPVQPVQPITKTEERSIPEPSCPAEQKEAADRSSDSEPNVGEAPVSSEKPGAGEDISASGITSGSIPFVRPAPLPEATDNTPAPALIPATAAPAPAPASIPATAAPVPGAAASGDTEPYSPGVPGPSPSQTEKKEIPATLAEAVSEKPLQPVIPEQPVENIASPQYRASIPDIDRFPDQSAVRVAPVLRTNVKKKKSKAGLIIGISAAAVVAGGCAAGYFFFHDDITRLFMGDSGYAQMITKNALADIVPTEEDAGKMTAQAINTSFAAAKTRENNNNNTSKPSIGSLIPGLSIPSFDIGSLIPSSGAIFGAADMIPDGTSLSVTSDIDVKLGSVLSGDSVGNINVIIGFLNSMSLDMKTISGDADLVSLGISMEGGNIASVELCRSPEGRITLALPGITDKVIGISDKGQDTGSIKGARFDAAEGKRIYGEIVKIFYESFDSAGITFKDGTETEAGGLSVSGTEVSISFTSEQVAEILEKTGTFLSSDTYVAGYASENLGISAEELKKVFDFGGKDGRRMPIVTISHIVDVHNNVLASSLYVKSVDSSKETRIKHIEKDKDRVVNVDTVDDSGTRYTVQAAVKETGEKDGTAVISLTKGGKDGFDISFDCEYSGFSKEKWLDGNVPVGTITAKPSDPEAFAAMFGGQSGSSGKGKTMFVTGDTYGIDTDKLISELKKLSLSLNSSVSGDRLSQTVSIYAGDIGSVTLNTVSVTGRETVSVPSDSEIIDINDSEAIKALGEDVIKGLGKALGKTGAFDTLLDGIMNMFTTERDEEAGATTSPVQAQAPVITDTARLAPEEMDEAARYISSAPEGLLGSAGSAMLYRKKNADEMIAVLKCDAVGYWTAYTAYADGREVSPEELFSQEFWNMTADRLNDISAEHGNINGLLAGLYFFGDRYAGVLVINAGDKADFYLYGLPKAENISEGIYEGWYSSGDYNEKSGYFADYDGNPIYVGTYCVRTGKRLVTPEEYENIQNGEEESGQGSDIGELKEHPELSDVMGLWKMNKPDDDGEYRTFAISSGAVFGYCGSGSDWFWSLKPTDDGFDAYENVITKVGSLVYSEETDMIKLTVDGENAEEIIFTRIGKSESTPCAGKWKMVHCDPASKYQIFVFTVDEYFLTINLMGFEPVRTFVLYKEQDEENTFRAYDSNLPESEGGFILEYDPDEDTFTMTEISDLGEETIMMFVRAESIY